LLIALTSADLLIDSDPSTRKRNELVELKKKLRDLLDKYNSNPDAFRGRKGKARIKPSSTVKKFEERLNSIREILAED